MSTKEKPDELWLMGAEGADVINLGRLEAVVKRSQLDATTKCELLDVINYVRTQMARNSKAPRRGPKIDPQLRLCAVIVGTLIEKYNIKKEAAVSAVVCENAGTEEERRKRRAAIYRAHTKLNAAGQKFTVSALLVKKALDRLCVLRIGSNSA